MKRADKRTEYVLVKASTNSEWDNISFAICRVTDEWLQTLQTRLDMLQPFTRDNDFWEHVYFGSPEGFYGTPDDWDVNEILNEGEAWAFVETNREELESLPLPESPLDTHQLLLDRYGNLQFKACGKYTGEEFYTDGFNTKDFLNRCEHYAEDTGSIEILQEKLSGVEQEILNAVAGELKRIGRTVSMDEFPYIPFSETVEYYVESITLDEDGQPILDCSFRDVSEKYLSDFLSDKETDHRNMISLVELLRHIRHKRAKVYCLKGNNGNRDLKVTINDLVPIAHKRQYTFDELVKRFHYTRYVPDWATPMEEEYGILYERYGNCRYDFFEVRGTDVVVIPGTYLYTTNLTEADIENMEIEKR